MFNEVLVEVKDTVMREAIGIGELGFDVEGMDADEIKNMLSKEGLKIASKVKHGLKGELNIIILVLREEDEHIIQATNSRISFEDNGISLETGLFNDEFLETMNNDFKEFVKEQEVKTNENV